VGRLGLVIPPLVLLVAVGCFPAESAEDCPKGYVFDEGFCVLEGSSDTDGGDTGEGTEDPDESEDPDDTGDPDDTEDTGEDDPEDVPDIGYCDDVASWDAGWAAWEEEVVDLVNLERSAGAYCGGTWFDPVPDLTMNEALRCAARVHSADMVDRDFFDHTNPDGESSADRISEAGYSWSTCGENIAQGYVDPADVVAGWMDSTGHCENIMYGGFEEIGVGYVPGSPYGGGTWTQTFGASW
jgi:hypothetical protein